jgi:hypothetical protein
LEGCGITQQHLMAFVLHSWPVQQVLRMLRIHREVGACQFLGSIYCALSKLNFLLVMRLRCACDALVMRLQCTCDAFAILLWCIVILSLHLNHFVTVAHNINHAKTNQDWMQFEWCSGSNITSSSWGAKGRRKKQEDSHSYCYHWESLTFNLHQPLLVESLANLASRCPHHAPNPAYYMSPTQKQNAVHHRIWYAVWLWSFITFLGMYTINFFAGKKGLTQQPVYQWACYMW